MNLNIHIEEMDMAKKQDEEQAASTDDAAKALEEREQAIVAREDAVKAKEDAANLTATALTEREEAVKVSEENNDKRSADIEKVLTTMNEENPAKVSRGASKPDFMAPDYNGPVTTTMIAQKEEFEKKSLVDEEAEKQEQESSED